MTTEQATYRYFKVFTPAITFYIAGTLAITWLSDSTVIATGALYALALIPIIAIYVAFWAHWRFATEIDEFLRLIQVKGTLVGIACVMIVASGWGILEALADAPRLPVFWLLPIFWVAQSLATLIISKREGVF